MLTDQIAELEKEEKETKPIEASVEYTYQNPFTVDIPNEQPNENIAYPGFPVEHNKHGVIHTAIEEFKEVATNVRFLHGLDRNRDEEPSMVARNIYPGIEDHFLYKPAPPGWNAKQEIEKLSNIDPKYLPRLVNARNPQDFQYRLNDVYSQQRHDEVLQNGSALGKILGGLIGYTPIGSIENFLPLTAIASKTKVGLGFLDAAMKNAPSMLAASAIREGAKQMDKTAPNLTEFLKDTFVDAAFGTVFFGGLGALKSSVNISEFNRLKDWSKKYLEGIGFEFVIDAKGGVKGFKAVDFTNGSVGAARLTMAQEQADSAFYKGGLFKVPYVGDVALSAVSGNIPGLNYIFGSPLVRLVNSKYRSVSAFANAAFDHFLTTETEMKGGTRPFSFEFNVKKTRAMLTDLKVQLTALHAERNGYTIKPRPALAIQNAWSAIKQKSIQALSQESKSTDYIAEDTFMDEVQNVLYSEVSSEHAAVNDAAALYRKVIDDTYKDWRVAHNLSEDWLPPKTAAAYLMRVYDIKYLNSHEGTQNWNRTVTNWLRESDQVIEREMQPIRETKLVIENHKSQHEALLRSTNRTDAEIKASSDQLELLKTNQKVLEESLQNKLRTDPELNIHVDDVNSLSADEAEQIKELTKRRDIAQKEIDQQKAIISGMKKEITTRKASAMKAKTVTTGKKKLRQSDTGALLLEEQEAKLSILEKEHEEEVQKIHEKISRGEVNPRFYKKEVGGERYFIKDTSERLKFREQYESDFHREQAAKGYYNSILQMKPEDIVADVFGKLTGKTSENVLKQRTLMIPDEILYNNNFMTKDLHAKTANYVNYLSKRTHLKNSFKNVTVNGDFEELAEGLLEEHNNARTLISERIERLKTSLEDAKPDQKKKIQKEIRSENKIFNKEILDFDAVKKDMKYLYETRMMGLNRRNDFDEMARRTWMSLTSASTLHNLPATQITDLAFAGFQHGLWPMVRDGVYPIINSMAGILKTKDSEALRKMAPHINLGYQDSANNFADRNWSSELQPMITMGKIQSGVEKYAQFSALTDLAPYIDNAAQHTHSSVIQSRFMELLHDEVKGVLTPHDSLYLRKYGIDPKIWAPKMVKAYQEANGFQTKLGGYISKAWEWQDVEAANLFSDAVFRGVQNTIVWKGMADSPFFADNILGLFFHTFTGWGYAATNRYLIPSLQHPDGEMLLKMAWMVTAGSLVSPTRRIARGEEPWPDDMTPLQIGYEAFTDSGVFSTIGNVLNIANFMSGDKLLGKLKNDKFKNRAKTGVFGIGDVVSSTASRISDVLGMANSGLNEKDMKTAAHMLPITGAMYGHYLSDKLIESWNLPRNKRAAELE